MATTFILYPLTNHFIHSWYSQGVPNKIHCELFLGQCGSHVTVVDCRVTVGSLEWVQSHIRVCQRLIQFRFMLINQIHLIGIQIIEPVPRNLYSWAQVRVTFQSDQYFDVTEFLWCVWQSDSSIWSIWHMSINALVCVGWGRALERDKGRTQQADKVHKNKAQRAALVTHCKWIAICFVYVPQTLETCESQ